MGNVSTMKLMSRLSLVRCTCTVCNVHHYTVLSRMVPSNNNNSQTRTLTTDHTSSDHNPFLEIRFLRIITVNGISNITLAFMSPSPYIYNLYIYTRTQGFNQQINFTNISQDLDCMIAVTNSQGQHSIQECLKESPSAHCQCQCFMHR